MLDKSIHVCWIDDFPHIGGSQRVLLHMSRLLQQEGHRVTIIAPGGGPFAEAAKDLPGAFVPLDLQTTKSIVSSPVHAIRVCFQLKRHMKRLRPDVVIANSLWCVMLLSILNMKQSPPIIGYLHAFPTVKTWWKRRLFQKFGSFVWETPTKWVLVSEALKSTIVPVFISNNKGTVIRNPLAQEWLTSSSDEVRENTASSVLPELEDSDFTIGVFGRLHDDKGQHIAIEALSVLQKDTPNAKLLIVGGNVEVTLSQHDYQHQLEALAKSLGIENNVILTGAIDDHREVRNLMAQCDVVVLPTAEESFGLVLIEAGALGIPVIATRTGGVSEAVVDGETGFLVESRRAEDYAKILKMLHCDPLLRQKIGEQARRYVYNSFSEKKALQQLLGVLQDGVETRR